MSSALRRIVPTLLWLGVILAPAFAAPAPAPYTDPVTGMQFVFLPGGTFAMGDPSGQDPYAQPLHMVTVKPFYLGKFEVSFNEYKVFCDATDRPLPDDAGFGRGQLPVINVSWHDAVAFTEWLSRKTGKTFRLPSEAEWEYAARGGTPFAYPWGNALGRGNATCSHCGNPWDGKTTSTVGSFSPNQFGLYDMAGNVYEWCLDARHDSYQGAPTDGSAWVADGQMNEWINRGGSWYEPPQEITVFRRCWDRADKRSPEYGFRVLLEP